MALPTNILQNVATYQMSELAYLQNLNAFISLANTKFKDFQKFKGNLGSSVTFDLPSRFTSSDTLVATFQASEQRAHTLTVDQAKNVSFAVSNQQELFNLDPIDYMNKFGKAAVEELGAAIESNVADNIARQHTYRFYGDGITPINSYNQLAKMLAFYRNYGSAPGKLDVILPDMVVPDIVSSGLNQFAPRRNDEEAMSWELGNWHQADFFQSNFLPLHTAGTAGQSAQTLTVVSTDDPTGANITQITFSGATASDADAIKEFDKMQFDDGVTGQPNMRFLTFVGHKSSENPVQLKVTADAAATGGGQVTVSIFPALQSTAGAGQNINNNIVAGMQVTVLPNHRSGVVVGGKAMYLAMPELPEEVPYPTATAHDPDTGVSLRKYFGSKFGENERGMITDCIWGSTMPDEYGMAIIVPE